MDIQLGLHKQVTHISKVKAPAIKPIKQLIVKGPKVALVCRRPKLDFKL